MKKLCCLLLIAVIITLCGCSVSKTDEETTEVNSIISSSNYFTVEYNGDFTFSYEIRDKSGSILLSDASEKDEPHIEILNESIVKLMLQRGTGISSQKTVYVNIENGIVSESFNSVFDEYNGRIAYHLYKDAKHYIIVSDIFDKEAFYKEFEITDNIQLVEDAVVSAEFSQDGKELSVTYLAGEDSKEATTEFIIG